MKGVLNGVVTASWVNRHYPHVDYRNMKRLFLRGIEGTSKKLSGAEVCKSGENFLILLDAVKRIYGEPVEITEE